MKTQLGNLFKSLFLVILLLTSICFYQCKPGAKENTITTTSKRFNVSLAQWSIHRALEDGTLQAENFAAIAKLDFGIDAVEYVNSFYVDHASDRAFWKKMRATADSLDVKSLLIMIDNEGDLGNPDAVARNKAVKNHFKWVDAANILGCHSVRVNAFGNGSKSEVQTAMISALKQLCEYAQNMNINVLIENHGLYSSDAKWVAEIMRQVNMSNCGTLPDFGNWCTAVKWGSISDGKCAELYDPYTGVSEMLPFAKGVSAKSYGFDALGEETKIDFKKMLKMVKDSDFNGYVGIEYEGSGISEADGIRATKALLEKAWQELSQ